jgi:phytoene dehydrogenase-like protein
MSEEKDAEPKYDVIIIGSGIAGLYTGVELLRRLSGATYRGLRVAIAERTGSLGGRVYTYKGGGHGGWDAGAGRISRQHHHVISLMRRYKLRFIPIGSEVLYKATAAAPLEPNPFEAALPIMMDTLAGLPAEQLARNTVRQLLTKVHGPIATDQYLLHFPYRAEVDILRADVAMEVFRGEMGSHDGYGICAGGLTGLVEGLAEEFKRRGGAILLEQELLDVEAAGAAVKCSFLVGKGDGAEKSSVIARHAVLAIPSAAAEKIPALRGWNTLRHLRMAPLVRIFAEFPAPADGAPHWFQAYAGTVVTAGHVRFMIPGSPKKGYAQISYTDGVDAEYWIERIRDRGEETVGREVVQELRTWLDPTIPSPTFVKAHIWKDGTTYWLPGAYDPVAASRAAVQPLPTVLPSLWACGESYSMRQAWMEGAVEHAELMLQGLLRSLGKEGKVKKSSLR